MKLSSYDSIYDPGQRKWTLSLTALTSEFMVGFMAKYKTFRARQSVRAEPYANCQL